jgi:hypothetical protein
MTETTSDMPHFIHTEPRTPRKVRVWNERKFGLPVDTEVIRFTKTNIIVRGHFNKELKFPLDYVFMYPTTPEQTKFEFRFAAE